MKSLDRYFASVLPVLVLLAFSVPVAIRAATGAPVVKEDGDGILKSLLKGRDPFKRPLMNAESYQAKPDLESFPVDQFRLSGVMTGPGPVRAMVVAPNGKTFYVSVGQRIGIQDGKIVKISAEVVEVEEYLVNLLGQKEAIKIELRLSDGNKGK